MSAYFVSDIPLLDAINVNCDEFGWDIGVDIDLLRAKYTDIKTSDIFLGKELCNGYEDGTMLRFKQGLRECRTSETVSQIAAHLKCANNRFIDADINNE